MVRRIRLPAYICNDMHRGHSYNRYRHIQIAFALSLLSLPAHAQLSIGGGAVEVSPPDLSGYATTTAVNQAIAASTTAVTSAIPAPCNQAPAADTLNGSMGAGNCFTPATASRPTVMQAAQVLTDGSGSWTVTWAKPFLTSTPFVRAEPINTLNQPIQCNVTATSATTASGKCWTSPNTITLPGLATALLGLVLNVNTTVATNTVVRVAGRDLTQ